MRTIRIIEHISLDGVIQQSADEDDFRYSDWTAPIGPPPAEMQFSPRKARASICCLTVAPSDAAPVRVDGRHAGKTFTMRTRSND